MSITFPPELFDRIIDFCHTDKRTLANLGLVCKQWIPSSRYHLFTAVELSNVNLEAFSDLLVAHQSTFAPFVVTVRLMLLSVDILEAIFPRFAHRLPAVRTLIIASHLSLTICDLLNTVFPHLTSLELNFSNMGGPHTVNFVSAFPVLENLSITGVEGLKPRLSVAHARSKRLPGTLRALSFTCTYFAGEHMLIWLLAHDDTTLPPISSLHIFGIEASGPLVERCLEAMHGCVRTLSLHYHRSRDVRQLGLPVNISALTELRVLVFDIGLSPGDTTPLVETLSQIASPHLVQLDATIYVLADINNNQHGDPVNTIAWAGVDDILQRPVFARLQKVNFTVRYARERRLVQAAPVTAATFLLVCEARGVAVSVKRVA